MIGIPWQSLSAYQSASTLCTNKTGYQSKFSSGTPESDFTRCVIRAQMLQSGSAIVLDAGSARYRMGDDRRAPSEQPSFVGSRRTMDPDIWRAPSGAPTGTSRRPGPWRCLQRSSEARLA